MSRYTPALLALLTTVVVAPLAYFAGQGVGNGILLLVDREQPSSLPSFEGIETSGTRPAPEPVVRQIVDRDGNVLTDDPALMDNTDIYSWPLDKADWNRNGAIDMEDEIKIHGQQRKHLGAE